MFINKMFFVISTLALLFLVQFGSFEDKRPDLNAVFPSYESALQKKRGVMETTTHKNLMEIKTILSKFLSKWRKRGKRLEKRLADKSGQGKLKQIHNDSSKEKDSVKWHPWTNWSTCSVTCGKGRVIRWRHCNENCNELETEMEEKSCQLPACEHKLFGVIKL